MQEPLNPSYPVLPLRDIVVFPHMVVPLFVGREKSVKALEDVMAEDKQILLSSQIDPAEDDPTTEGIYDAGVLANVLQLLKLPQRQLGLRGELGREHLADAEARLQLEAGEGEEGEGGGGGAGADVVGRHDCLFVEPTLASEAPKEPRVELLHTRVSCCILM